MLGERCHKELPVVTQKASSFGQFRVLGSGRQLSIVRVVSQPETDKTLASEGIRPACLRCL